MQVLKENLRSLILSEARKEFISKGYEKASIKNIADRCGMSVGNIYRYFKNKEEMFDVIVSPVYNQMKQYILSSHDAQNLKEEKDAYRILEEDVQPLLNIYLESKEELLLLVFKSKGAKYENIVNEMIEIKINHVNELLTVMKECELSHQDLYFSKLVSEITVEGLLKILKQNMDNDHEMLKITENFLAFILAGLMHYIKLGC